MTKRLNGAAFAFIVASVMAAVHGDGLHWAMTYLGMSMACSVLVIAAQRRGRRENADA